MEHYSVALWTPELDSLLERWKLQIAAKKRSHLRLSITYTRRHYYFGIPATVLGTMTTTGILSTFRNCDHYEPNNEPSAKCEADEAVRLCTGIIGVVSTGLSAVQTFMNYQTRGEQHKAACDAYESLHRTIDSLLQVPVAVRGDPVAMLRSIRSQYDDIGKTYPPILEDDAPDLLFRTPEERGIVADRSASVTGRLAAQDQDHEHRALHGALAFEMMRLRNGNGA